MKKTRIIVLALAVAIAVMGAGYAAWTQDVTVTGTVNTGKLELAITDTAEGAYYQYYKTNKKLDWTNEELDKYGLITAPKEDKTTSTKISFNRKNIFPGIEAIKTVTIENKGTVPVKLERVDFSKLNGKCDNLELVLFISNNPIDSSDKTMTGGRFLISTLKKGGNLTQDYHSLELLPGEKYYAQIGVSMSTEVTDTESETNKFTCELQFVQSNLQHPLSTND